MATESSGSLKFLRAIFSTKATRKSKSILPDPEGSIPVLDLATGVGYPPFRFHKKTHTGANNAQMPFARLSRGRRYLTPGQEKDLSWGLLLAHPALVGMQ